MANGKKRVERIPKEWVEEVRRRVAAGREFQDAVKEVLTAETEGPVSGPSALQLFHYASHCLGLKSYFQHPGDGRPRPRIPAQLWHGR